MTWGEFNKYLEGLGVMRHIRRVDNPHAVTKSQVGLSNVANSLQLIAANNLSDIPNAGTARTNLGLGTLATLNSIDISANTNLGASSPLVLTGDTLSFDTSALLATLSATYLELDASNSPLTGTLTSRSIIPSANNTYDLGDSSNKFNDLFVDKITLNSTAYFTNTSAGIVTYTGEMRYDMGSSFGDYFRFGLKRNSPDVIALREGQSGKNLISFYSQYGPYVGFGAGNIGASVVDAAMAFDGSGAIQADPTNFYWATGGSGNANTLRVQFEGANYTGDNCTIEFRAYRVSNSTNAPQMRISATDLQYYVNHDDGYFSRLYGGRMGRNQRFGWGAGESGYTAIDAKFHVEGTADEIQAITQAHSTQTENIHEWRADNDTVLAAIDSTGAFEPVSLADSAAPNNSIYYSSTASKLVYKDAGGSVNALY